MTSLDRMIRSRTFWTAVIAIITTLGMWATGEIDRGAAIQTIATGLLAIFLRDGVAKSEKQATAAKVAANRTLDAVEDQGRP